MAEKKNVVRLIRIATSLLEATRLGNVAWELRTRGRGLEQYDYSTTDTTVSLRCVDNDNSHPYSMTIKNEAGIVLDELLSTYKDENIVDEAGIIEDLYQEARRQALNIDRTLDKLLDDLDRLPPF